MSIKICTRGVTGPECGLHFYYETFHRTENLDPVVINGFYELFGSALLDAHCYMPSGTPINHVQYCVLFVESYIKFNDLEFVSTYPLFFTNLAFVSVVT